MGKGGYPMWFWVLAVALAEPAVSALADPLSLSDEVPARPRQKPPLQLLGRVMLDTNRTLDPAAPDDQPWLDIRRARFQLKYKPIDEVRLKLDWNLEKMVIHDLYGDFGTDTYWVRVGQSKMPVSAAFLESSLHLPFAERPMLHDVLQNGRFVGGNLMTSHEHFFAEIAGGQTRPFDSEAGSTEVYLHGIWKPVDGIWASGAVSVGDQVALVPEFVSVSGAEWATVSQPVTGLAERATLGGSMWSAPLRFDIEGMGLWGEADEPLSVVGGYAEVLWMITGEEHRYAKTPTPNNPIHSGLGAFELGLRYEKLWSRGVVDGEASAVTGGLTWFAHKHIKVPFNLVYTQTPVWNETTLVVRFQASG
ncbi:MAG: hypothetical protein ACI8S6_003357 [Myxococcota bacterium]|jgi:hypothetical protein